MAQRFGLPVTLDHPALPRRGHRDRGRAGHPGPRVRRVGGRPADLDRASGWSFLPLAALAHRRPLLELRRARGWPAPTWSSACSTWCPGCRSTAAGCCGRRSGSSPATRTAGTVVAGWGGRVARGARAGLPVRPQLVAGSPADVDRLRLRLRDRRFLWSGASASIVSARVRAGCPSLRARTLARRTLAVPARPAARRGGPPRAGGAGRQHRRARPRPATPTGDRQRGRRAAPRPRTAGPGCRSAPWPARLEPGLTLPADLSGEPLILAMQKAPATEYLLLDGGRQRLRRAGHRGRRPGLRRRRLTRSPSRPRERVLPHVPRPNTWSGVRPGPAASPVSGSGSPTPRAAGTTSASRPASSSSPTAARSTTTT